VPGLEKDDRRVFLPMVCAPMQFPQPTRDFLSNLAITSFSVVGVFRERSPTVRGELRFYIGVLCQAGRTQVPFFLAVASQGKSALHV